MPSNASHIAQLIIKSLNDEITIEEKKELRAWMDSSQSNKAIADQFLIDENLFNGLKETFNAEEKVWSRLSNHITQDAPVIPIHTRRIKNIRWVAAACIILLLGIATYVILSTGRRPATEGQEGRLAHDVPPPSNTRAVITLANGNKIYLDSVGNGTIARENSINVVKNNNGEIQYQAGANGEQPTANSPVYNTLFNPRGSKVISLTLSDGTKVWLNSESSLRYPASFVPSAVSREVEITGEAYFEVKHNAQKPFKVHLPNGSVIEDLGTAFNVNAYADESDIKTTLIEGSVKVVANGDQRTAKGQSIVLKPGEQAIEKPNSPLTTDHSPNLDEVTAWKDGRFSFKSTDIKSLMRQLSRWYDVDINYQEVPSTGFNAHISRQTPISSILKALELTGEVKFKIEGKKITVLK